MKLNDPIFAIVDPETNEILGDGECSAIHPSEPDQAKVDFIARISGHKCVVVPCKIVEAENELLRTAILATIDDLCDKAAEEADAMDWKDNLALQQFAANTSDSICRIREMIGQDGTGFAGNKPKPAQASAEEKAE